MEEKKILDVEKKMNTKKMKGFWKNKSTSGKIGVIIFIMINVSFGFTLLSPYISNPIVVNQNAKILAQIDDNIEKYRTGNISIQVVDSIGNPISDADIVVNLSNHEFHFGALWQFGDLTGNPSIDDVKCENYTKVFNTATIPMWWAYCENDIHTNRSIEFCEKNGIHMRAQCVYWPFWESEPEWVHEIQNETELYDALYERMLYTVDTYKENITDWEIFNEFAHWGTDYHGLNRYEFMKRATHWAHEISPDINIVVNDFFSCGHGGASGDIYWFYEGLEKNDVLYDAIGIQAHQFQTDWYNAVDLYESFDAFGNLGKKIHITEFMVPSAPVPITNSYVKGLWSEEMQAECTEEFYRVCFSHPAVDTICWWTTKENNGKQGIFDEDGNPKPAWYVIDNLVNNEWHTEESLTSDSEGNVNYQGFFGTYDITIDGVHHFEISANSTSTNQFLLQIT